MRYRASQFFRSLRNQPLSDAEFEDVQSLLSQEQLLLFGQLTAPDQQHSYRVMQFVRSGGERNQDLLAAALLHDVGKANKPVTVWERSLVVLVEKAFPGSLGRFGNGPAEGWKRAFVVKAQHPGWGADLVSGVDSSDMILKLVRRHHEYVGSEDDGEEARLLRILQRADSVS